MEQKWTYSVWSAAGGAVALAIVGFSWGGWVTGGTAAKLADEAAMRALIPVCAQAMLGDPVAVEALKAKRASDYDDVVRDVWKPVGFTAPSSYQFRRDCGAAIQGLMAKAATKS
jgi:alpha/beta superfamily hydrolase